MKKRFLSALLVIAMLCALLPQVAVPAFAATYSGKCGDNVTWELDTETGVLTISGEGEMNDYTSSSYAPWNSYSSSVKSITIDSGVTSIGDGAFADCTGLTSITIPGSVTSIGGYAFYGCTGLTSVSIPDSVASIGGYAFYNCTGLTSVTIPDSVTSIGYDAFYGTAPYNDDFNWQDDILYIDNCLIKAKDDIVNLNIKSGTRVIAVGAFMGCKWLTGVTIPNSVTSIGDYAFSGCSRLEKVNFGNGVKKVGDCAFSGCSRLEKVNFGNGVKKVGDYAFSGCTALKDVYFNMNKEQWKKWIWEIEWGSFLYEEQTNYEKHIIKFLNNATIHFLFSDVADTAFYADAVAWAVSHDPQVTNGMTETTFAPGNKCTRVQVVTFLWRAAGCPEPTSSNNPFTDVKSGAYYYKAVLWAVEKGVTSGMSATSFAPNAECTRGQVVTFLWRAKGKPAPTKTAHKFTDVDPKGFYYNAMLWAVETGVTNGMSETKFAPNATCTRGQVVTFLYRAFK